MNKAILPRGAVEHLKEELRRVQMVNYRLIRGRLSLIEEIRKLQKVLTQVQTSMGRVKYSNITREQDLQKITKVLAREINH